MIKSTEDDDDVLTTLRSRQHDTEVAADDRDLMRKAGDEIERLRMVCCRLQAQTFEIADLMARPTAESNPHDGT